MKKSTFWNDAALCGILMGVAGAIFQFVAIQWPTSTLLSFCCLALFVVLLFISTKNRSTSAKTDGFSYGQGLKFIFWVMVFAGIVTGAWEIVARNVFFTEKYEEVMNQALATVESFYPADMFDMMVSMSRKVMFSPIWIVVASVLGSVIKGVFFGLFIAAFTRRNPDIFAKDESTDAE